MELSMVLYRSIEDTRGFKMKTQLLRGTLKCFSLSSPPTSHSTCDGSKTTIFLEQLLGVCGREERGMQGAQFPSHLSLSLSFCQTLDFHFIWAYTSCQFLFRYYPVNICLKVFFLHIFIRSKTKVGECHPLGRF